VRPKNHNDANGYYELFGVNPWADKEQIKEAYRRLVRDSHPDVGGDPDLFRLHNQIFKVLMDDLERAIYDSTPEDGSIYLGGVEVENVLRTMPKVEWETFLDSKKIKKTGGYSYFGYKKNSRLAQKWYSVLIPVYQVIGMPGTVRLSLEEVERPEWRKYPKQEPLLVIPIEIEPNYFTAFFIVLTLLASEYGSD